jgi:hypothetical protein
MTGVDVDDRVEARRARFAGTRAVSRSRRLLLWLAIAVVGYTVIHGFLGGATAPGNGSQRRSSSFDIGDDGTRAYADLLVHYGYTVLRQEGSLAHAGLPPRGTVILFDAPALATDEANRLLAFVSDGGRLVVGGADPPFLGRLLRNPPAWGSVRRARWSVDDPREFGRVSEVATASEGAWTYPGSTTVRVGDQGESLLTEMHLGFGSMVFVADTTPFNNFLIGSADNAAFAVAVAGSQSEPIVFAEGVHGYEGATGWAALPSRWRLALVVLLAVAALFAWSRGVRLGPPESEERELAPARAEYVDAIGATLHRVADRESSRAAMAAAARALLTARGTALPDESGATNAQLDYVAAAVGSTRDAVGMLFTPGAAVDDTSLMAAARAFAAIERTASSMGRPDTSVGVM